MSFTTTRRRMALVLLLVLAACEGHYLQIAQDSFDKGAAIENRMSMPVATAIPPGEAPGGDPPTTGSAAAYYLDARKNVCTAINHYGSDLAKDGMTAQALIILALTNWRLDGLLGKGDDSGDRCGGHDYRAATKAAIADATQAGQKEPESQGERFLLAMLPGLLDHNSGLRKTSETPMDASNDFGSAFKVLGDAGKIIAGQTPPIDLAHPPTSLHQLREYGFLAQIQVLKARYAAVLHANEPSVTTPGQHLTTVERKACADSLVRVPGQEVIAQLKGLDPDGTLIGRDTLKSISERPLFNGKGPPAPGCPWLP